MSGRGRCIPATVSLTLDHPHELGKGGEADKSADAPADTIESDSKLDEVDKPVLSKESPANK